MADAGIQFLDDDSLDGNEASDRPYARRRARIPPRTPIQGISIISTERIPERYRSVFPYPTFNDMQSKCFQQVYMSDKNFVLSSPTGSGKTVILELAICRLLQKHSIDQYKIVYQGFTKSLCAERQRDWQSKFSSLGLKCTEFTGDSEHTQLAQVRAADIIITTPEKWDSMTRKWKDQQKLMQLIKLFLIDEVHMLKDERGATLEAVVSRMKSVQSDVRFIALSATIPNAEDVAQWLSDANQIPANLERFGEEFRPTKIEKHVIGVNSNGHNLFAFDKKLDSKLNEMISKYSQGKPIIIFCTTRKICSMTAKNLADWWHSSNPKQRYWKAHTQSIQLNFQDSLLRETFSAGVAFHHAGLHIRDRNTVEHGYLRGEINVICCTSTLAVGVNLPCHMVIIKGTMTYQGDGLMQEMSELDVLQMIGRAGRPQFDTSAVAIIMTQKDTLNKWKKLVCGEEILESCFHKNLIEHLNSEIVLKTVNCAEKAKKWLKDTFFFIRFQKNPKHYQIDFACNENPHNDVDYICEKGIKLLQDYELINDKDTFGPTIYGDTVSQYYIQIETARIFLDVPYQTKISEILSAICHAHELKDIRWRQNEKQVYRDLNKSNLIRFPIHTSVDIVGHKISLLIQSVLGGVDLPVTNDAQQFHSQFQMDQQTIIRTVRRLLRCLIDFSIHKKDSIAARNALMIYRSVCALGWDDGPMQMRQIEGIGIASIRKLCNVGITSIDALEQADPNRVETALKKKPPFGRDLQAKLNKTFPKLRVSLSSRNIRIRKGEGAEVDVQAEIGLLNDTYPQTFAKKLIYVVLLVEVSDGRGIFFLRCSIMKLGSLPDINFSAKITGPMQTINCYIMCDEIAGSMKCASLKPTVPSHAWPPTPLTIKSIKPKQSKQNHTWLSFGAKAQTNAKLESTLEEKVQSDDEYEMDTVNDSELARAVVDVSQNDLAMSPEVSSPIIANVASQRTFTDGHVAFKPVQILDEPERLPNGRFKCKHHCKDKTKCKHFCCREGLDAPPKVKKQINSTAFPLTTTLNNDCRSPFQNPVYEKNQNSCRLLDLTVPPHQKHVSQRTFEKPPAFRALSALHDKAQRDKTQTESSQNLDNFHSNLKLTSQIQSFEGIGSHNSKSSGQFDGDGYMDVDNHILSDSDHVSLSNFDDNNTQNTGESTSRYKNTPSFTNAQTLNHVDNTLNAENSVCLSRESIQNREKVSNGDKKREEKENDMIGLEVTNLDDYLDDLERTSNLTTGLLANEETPLTISNPANTLQTRGLFDYQYDWPNTHDNNLDGSAQRIQGQISEDIATPRPQDSQNPLAAEAILVQIPCPKTIKNIGEASPCRPLESENFLASTRAMDTCASHVRMEAPVSERQCSSSLTVSGPVIIPDLTEEVGGTQPFVYEFPSFHYHQLKMGESSSSSNMENDVPGTKQSETGQRSLKRRSEFSGLEMSSSLFVRESTTDDLVPRKRQITEITSSGNQKNGTVGPLMDLPLDINDEDVAFLLMQFGTCCEFQGMSNERGTGGGGEFLREAPQYGAKKSSYIQY